MTIQSWEPFPTIKFLEVTDWDTVAFKCPHRNPIHIEIKPSHGVCFNV